MRINSAIVSLIVIWNIVFPQNALATKIENINETKIIFKIKNEIYLNEGIIMNDSKINSSLLYIPNDYVPIKSPEEIKRENILNKWKKKQERLWKNLPEKSFSINASAYTAAADECGKSDGITASGLKVKEKNTIACPPEFPFGVKIKIENYGIYVCEDRGGAIKGNKFDIYMLTKKEAFAFGRRNLLAEIVLE